MAEILDRRRFLHAGALGAAGILGGRLWTGQAATAAAATTPSRGGTLKWATLSGGPKDTLDPAKTVGNHSLVTSFVLYDTLVRVDQNFTPEPRLATQWSVSPDGKTWKFRLRDGVTFHNGKTLSAQDVAYSIGRILDPAVGSSGKGTLEPLLEASGIGAPDPTTVVFTLKGPNAFLPVILSDPAFGVVPDGTTHFASGTGTGAFKLKSFETGTGGEYERNPNFWRSGLPYLDGLRLVVLGDIATEVEGVISGDVDICDFLPMSYVKVLQASPGAKAVTIPEAIWVNLAANTQEKPFNDPRVVAAFKHAQDRKAIMKVIAAGLGTVGGDIPVPPGDPFYPKGFKYHEYDPEKARSLLKQAGYPNGIDVTLYAKADIKLDLALAYKDVARKAGIRVNVVNSPAATYWDQIWLKKPFITDDWVRRHVSVMLPLAFSRTAPWNETKFQSEEFDSLVVKAAQTVDARTQRELYAQALRLLQDKSGAISPGFVPLVFGAKQRVQNMKHHWRGQWAFEEISLA
jgi:peptide/nickel transport system substrate-binding protein